MGTHAVAWANTTQRGSPVLLADVHYPAVAAGVDTPVAPKIGGWPVIVFLHGYGADASYYHLLADSWAAAGYVVVLSNTCLTDWINQPFDGRALYSAVQSEGASSNGFFGARIDTRRVAIAGHSMGGASTGAVLAANPGYACGFVIAPATPLASITGLVHVPFGIVAGLGDWVTPPAAFATPYWNGLGQGMPFKFYHLLDASVDHTNIVALGGTPSMAFEHTAALGQALFDQCFGGDPLALRVIDGSTQPNALVQSVDFAATQPLLWANADLQIGQTTVVSISAQPGFTALVAAAGLAPPVTTQFGTLLVDAASAYVFGYGQTNAALRADFSVVVPNDPTLVGLAVALQGSGTSTTAPFVLGNAILLHAGL